MWSGFLCKVSSVSVAATGTVVHSAGVGLSLSHFLPREVEPLGIAHRCKAEETTPLLIISPVTRARVFALVSLSKQVMYGFL